MGTDQNFLKTFLHEQRLLHEGTETHQNSFAGVDFFTRADNFAKVFFWFFFILISYRQRVRFRGNNIT